MAHRLSTFYQRLPLGGGEQGLRLYNEQVLFLSAWKSDISLETVLAQSQAAGVELSIIVAPELSTHSYGENPLPVHGDGLAQF